MKRNAFESVLMMWMNLEPIIQSEVSQKENLEKIVLKNLFTGSNGATDIENRIIDLGWGRRGRKKLGYMKRETWKLVLPYVKHIADGKVLYDSGN